MSLPQILIILLIVLLIFGTKRIRNIGSDLGGAIREFRHGVRDDEADDKKEGDKKEGDTKPESGDEDSAEKTRKRSASGPDS